VLNDIEIGNLFLTGDQEMVQSSEQIRKFWCESQKIWTDDM
jgi:hypothetical protein